MSGRDDLERSFEVRSRGEAAFVGRLERYLNADGRLGKARADSNSKLDYADYRWGYTSDSKPLEHNGRRRAYKPDLLIYDQQANGDWVPLVVIEGKYGAVTTHDLITYADKAAAHRTLHPYLRYGFIVGGWSRRFQGRMVAHGSRFDFMAILPSDTAEEDSFARIAEILRIETDTARILHTMHRETTLPSGAWLVHRRLEIGTLPASQNGSRL